MLSHDVLVQVTAEQRSPAHPIIQFNVPLPSLLSSLPTLFPPPSHPLHSVDLKSIQSARLSVQSSELGPLTCKRVLLRPIWIQGEDTHSLAGEGDGTQFRRRDRHSRTLGILYTHYLAGEGVGNPISDEGTDTLVLYVYYNPSTIDSTGKNVPLLREVETNGKASRQRKVPKLSVPSCVHCARMSAYESGMRGDFFGVLNSLLNYTVVQFFCC
jgi:hypothetical protein